MMTVSIFGTSMGDVIHHSELTYPLDVYVSFRQPFYHVLESESFITVCVDMTRESQEELTALLNITAGNAQGI